MFFPLGLVLAWAGVSHWLVLATLGVGPYDAVFHSITQVQGFMTCFAVGFLFTAIPRRTGTPPPAAWEAGIGLVAPVGSTVAAWLEAYALSQVFWLILLGVLVQFAVRRFRSSSASRRPPNGFVWVPLALCTGALGAGCMAAYGVWGPESFALHELGKRLLLQGTLLGLVIGVGSMVLPLITCGDAPPDGRATPRDRASRATHALGAAALATSFWIETRSASLGFALRAAVCGGFLLVSGRTWRLPRVPGWHRWGVWVSAWLIPTGYVLAAAQPASAQAGLHVVFIGGFALMAFSVGFHVAAAHGGRPDLVHGRPWQVPAIGVVLALALSARCAMVFDPAWLWRWMGLASGSFLFASGLWGSLVLPLLWSRGAPRPLASTPA